MTRFRSTVAVVVLALLMGLVGNVFAQDEVNLTFWHALQDAEGDAMLALIDAFEAANPGVTVEAIFNPSDTIQDSFINAAGAGEGPDLIMWANDSAGTWATAGLVVDISDMIDEELESQVAESGWGTFTFEGGIYGVPVNAKTLAMFYNKSLVLDAPADWDEVFEISEELAADDLTGLVFNNGFFHSAGFLFALDGSLMDDEGNATFGEGGEGYDAMVEYLAFHQMIYELGQDEASGVLISGDSPYPGFQTGEVAMLYDGIWNLAQYTQDLGDDLGVALMPELENGEVPAMFAQTTGIFPTNRVAEDEAKMEAFMAFSKFLTSEAGQLIGLEEASWMPVNPNVTIEDNENLQTFAEQFTLGAPFPNRAELGAFWGPMADAIAAVGSSGEAPEDAALAAFEQIQATIDDMHMDSDS